MELQQQQEVKFSKAGVDFIIRDEERNGVMWYIARANQPTPKGKYSNYKNIWAYRFRTVLERDQYVAKYIEQAEARLKRVQDDKDARKAATKAAVNPFKVGDLFYDSWGYDQTNIDFYQVVGVGKMSVVIREIASKGVEGTQGFMCEDVVPMKGVFTGEPITKIVKVRVWSGKVSYGFGGKYDHGHLSPTNETTKHYSSWYA
jgi:hypothetical protein